MRKWFAPRRRLHTPRGLNARYACDRVPPFAVVNS